MPSSSVQYYDEEATTSSTSSLGRTPMRQDRELTPSSVSSRRNAAPQHSRQSGSSGTRSRRTGGDKPAKFQTFSHFGEYLHNHPLDYVIENLSRAIAAGMEGRARLPNGKRFPASQYADVVRHLAAIAPKQYARRYGVIGMQPLSEPAFLEAIAPPLEMSLGHGAYGEVHDYDMDDQHVSDFGVDSVTGGGRTLFPGTFQDGDTDSSGSGRMPFNGTDAPSLTGSGSHNAPLYRSPHDLLSPTTGNEQFRPDSTQQPTQELQQLMAYQQFLQHQRQLAQQQQQFMPPAQPFTQPPPEQSVQQQFAQQQFSQQQLAQQQQQQLAQQQQQQLAQQQQQQLAQQQQQQLAQQQQQQLAWEQQMRGAQRQPHQASHGTQTFGAPPNAIGSSQPLHTAPPQMSPPASLPTNSAHLSHATQSHMGGSLTPAINSSLTTSNPTPKPTAPQHPQPMGAPAPLGTLPQTSSGLSMQPSAPPQPTQEPLRILSQSSGSQATTSHAAGGSAALPRRENASPDTAAHGPGGQANSPSSMPAFSTMTSAPHQSHPPSSSVTGMGTHVPPPSSNAGSAVTADTQPNSSSGQRPTPPTKPPGMGSASGISKTIDTTPPNASHLASPPSSPPPSPPPSPPRSEPFSLTRAHDGGELEPIVVRQGSNSASATHSSPQSSTPTSLQSSSSEELPHAPETPSVPLQHQFFLTSSDTSPHLSSSAQSISPPASPSPRETNKPNSASTSAPPQSPLTSSPTSAGSNPIASQPVSPTPPSSQQPNRTHAPTRPKPPSRTSSPTKHEKRIGRDDPSLSDDDDDDLTGEQGKSDEKNEQPDQLNLYDDGTGSQHDDEELKPHVVFTSNQGHEKLSSSSPRFENEDFLTERGMSDSHWDSQMHEKVPMTHSSLRSSPPSSNAAQGMVSSSLTPHAASNSAPTPFPLSLMPFKSYGQPSAFSVPTTTSFGGSNSFPPHPSMSSIPYGFPGAGMAGSGIPPNTAGYGQFSTSSAYPPVSISTAQDPRYYGSSSSYAAPHVSVVQQGTDYTETMPPFSSSNPISFSSLPSDQQVFGKQATSSFGSNTAGTQSAFFGNPTEALPPFAFGGQPPSSPIDTFTPPFHAEPPTSSHFPSNGQASSGQLSPRTSKHSSGSLHAPPSGTGLNDSSDQVGLTFTAPDSPQYPPTTKREQQDDDVPQVNSQMRTGSTSVDTSEEASEELEVQSPTHENKATSSGSRRGSGSEVPSVPNPLDGTGGSSGSDPASGKASDDDDTDSDGSETSPQNSGDDGRSNAPSSAVQPGSASQPSSTSAPSVVSPQPSSVGTSDQSGAPSSSALSSSVPDQQDGSGSDGTNKRLSGSAPSENEQGGAGSSISKTPEVAAGGGGKAKSPTMWQRMMGTPKRDDSSSKPLASPSNSAAGPSSTSGSDRAIQQQGDGDVSDQDSASDSAALSSSVPEQKGVSGSNKDGKGEKKENPSDCSMQM